MACTDHATMYVRNCPIHVKLYPGFRREGKSLSMVFLFRAVVFCGQVSARLVDEFHFL